MISSPTRVLTAIGTFAAATSLALAVVQPASAAPGDDAGTVQLLVQVDPLNWDVDVLSYGSLLDVAVTAGSSQRAANSGPGDLLLARWDGSEVTFQMSGGLTSPAYPRERTLSPIAMTLKGASNGDLKLELGSIDGTGVPGYVPTRHSLTKHVHEASGSTYYQLRLGPAEPSPDVVPQKATSNIASLLQDGVSQGDCTVARKMRPGDTLTTGTGDEVVCVTLDVEPSTNRQLPYEPPIPPIRIDTGAGDDIVLIDGETDAEVVVQLGSGDDVAVVATSSDVTVVAGRGDDALLGNGENTTLKGGAGVDIAIGASEGSSDWDRSIFGPGISAIYCQEPRRCVKSAEPSTRRHRSPKSILASSHCPERNRAEVMAILVDDAIWPWRNRLWAHLISDESLDELHAFAARLNLPERAFGGDHYDVTDELRECAIAEGAVPVDSRTIVRSLHAAGLRKRPAHHHQP